MTRGIPVLKEGDMVKRSNILVGTAGVYFVAYQLAAMGFHAAPTSGNAPNIDLLVASEDGKASLCIQVKTSFNALHMVGKRPNKQPQYQWDVGEKSAKIKQENLFFAFVDLKGDITKMPDVFIGTSEKLYQSFLNKSPKRWRYHRSVEWIEQYKNKWETLTNYLNSKAPEVSK
jgi:hypothetical protein